MARKTEQKPAQKADKPAQIRVSSTDLSRGYLSPALDRVLKGETIFILRKGEVIAKLAPSTEEEAAEVADALEEAATKAAAEKKVVSDPYLELLGKKPPVSKRST